MLGVFENLTWFLWDSATLWIETNNNNSWTIVIQRNHLVLKLRLLNSSTFKSKHYWSKKKPCHCSPAAEPFILRLSVVSRKRNVKQKIKVRLPKECIWEPFNNNKWTPIKKITSAAITCWEAEAPGLSL